VKILVCSLEAPLPPVNGFRLHLEALLSELRRAHDVRVVAMRYPDQTAPTPDPSVRLVRRPSIGLLGKAAAFPRSALARRPLGVDALAGRLRGPLREELDRFEPDVVHVTPGDLAMLAGDLRGRPAVLVAADAWYLNIEAVRREARPFRRTMLGLQAGWVRHFEGSRFRSFDRVVVVSEEDRDALVALDPTLQVSVVPNGVDAERFVPGPFDQREPGHLVFTGVMSYAPNVTAATFLGREVLPLVRQTHPSAHLSIVGRDPAPTVRAMGKVEGIDIVGEVPDVGPWLRRARVYTCPMLTGTGIKNKLLEAMACAAPCVATPLAIRGTTVIDGRELLIGRDRDELAARVSRALAEDALADSLGKAARAYVTAEHAWPAAAAAYEQIYAAAIDHHRRRSRSASHTT
jgi:glycosyltransferase involved in cell wall biosynthesis